MNETAHILQRLGFGDYEARAYIGMLGHGPVSGYELARLSGIPRANVYEILPRLEERGAVVRVDSPSGARYAAVPPSELMPRLAARFNDDLVAAEDALAGAAQPHEQDYAWNVETLRSVIDHARTLIDSAEKELLVATWPQEASVLASSLLRARERGVSITTLCLAACAQECGACQGNIYHYRLSPQEAGRWLVLAADNKEMLAGEIAAGDTASAVRTTRRLLVELAGWYVRNSVALATLAADLGDRLPALLSLPTLSVLSSLGRDGDWKLTGDA